MAMGRMTSNTQPRVAAGDTFGSMPRMECMQVRGGSGVADTAVSTTGLDVWLYSKPYGDVSHGGDVYYLSSCSSGRITRVALADVRGHGAEVAGLADRLRLLMQRHIDHIDQTTLVESINKEFVVAGDWSTFATGLILTFFVPTATLSVTNAGHPSPLHYQARRGQWRTLEPEPAPGQIVDVPLGIFEDARYAQQRLAATSDDLLLCFTDGLTESVDERGEMLGLEGVRNVAAQLDPAEPQGFIRTLVDRVAEMHPTNLTEDDVTVLLIRPNGATVSLRDNLLAPFRYVSNLARHWRA